MEMLSNVFELDPPMVHAIISKMIINEELMALWTSHRRPW